MWILNVLTLNIKVMTVKYFNILNSNIKTMAGKCFNIVQNSYMLIKTIKNK